MSTKIKSKMEGLKFAAEVLETAVCYELVKRYQGLSREAKAECLQALAEEATAQGQAFRAFFKTYEEPKSFRGTAG